MKTKCHWFRVIGAACVVWAGCASHESMPEAVPDTPEERTAVRAAVERSLDALNRGEVEAFVEMHADDAIVVPPGRPPRKGKAAIRQSMDELFQQWAVQETRTIDELWISGEWAWLWGTYDSTLTPRLGGAALTERGMYIDVLRKQADGSWKFTWTIWNSSGPPAGPSP